MATTFLNRFHREKSERQGLVAADNNVNSKSKKKDKDSGSGGKAADDTNGVGIMSPTPTDMPNSETATPLPPPTSEATITATTTTAATTSQQQPSRQQRRYIRSATAASVTQLLSESYSSLLQRFRRHPSERPDKSQNQQHQKRNRDIKGAANDERRDTSKTPTNFDNNNSKSVKDRERLFDNCESATNNNKHSNEMSERRRYYGGGGAGGGYYAGGGGTSTGRYQKSATAVSALDRLRSNLSPVTSYYKPLMRSFGRRADDDRKDTDKDRTPTAGGTSKLSAISRLENKYSDVLDRHRHHEDDRDKTLEPDENRNPLSKSSTSHQLLGAGRPKLSSGSFNAVDRKERTPYRLGRNKTNRYLGDSNDSGYITSTNGSARGDHTTLLDENYPLDYGGSRYRRNYEVPRHHLENYEALRAGGAMGYAPGSSRSGRGAEYAAGYNARSYRSRDVYDDYGNGAGGGIGGSSSRNRPRAYGRNKTSENLLASATETVPSAHSSFRPDYEDYGVPNSRNRFAHRRKENITQRVPTRREELTDEDREILNDERSSADNAAILLLLKEDNQYLEARKFEERMRKRKELQGRLLRYAQEDAAAAAAEKVKLEKNSEKEIETKKTEANSSKQEINANNGGEASNAMSTTQKTTSNLKKVASPIIDSDSSSESSSEESDSSSQGDKPATSPTTNSNTITTTALAKDTEDSTKVPTTTNLSTSKELASQSTYTSTPSSTSSAGSSVTALHADRNNNDLSKYRPTAGSSFKSNGGLMHSSSSGALAFGGISERLAAGRSQRYQPATSSRTAALLADLDTLGPTADSSSSRYQQYKNPLNDSYKSSYLFDPYYSYGGAGGSSVASSRRTGTAAGLSSSTSAYQRQQIHAYQQHQQQQLHQYQQHQHILSKSATSAALFQRSRIPKTLSAFVSELLIVICVN